MITQKKRFASLLNIIVTALLVFLSFKIGKMFGLKDPVPRGLRAGVVFKFSCAAVPVMPAMSAKPPGIFPRAYMSTSSVIGPLTFLNTDKILGNAALHALMIVSVS